MVSVQQIIFFKGISTLISCFVRYKFNDSTVTEMNESGIVQGTAYVLFYKRR
jgi:hypothetical protein